MYAATADASSPRAIPAEAKAVGLGYVTIKTSPDNLNSISVIEKVGGTLIKTYKPVEALGGHATLQFQIALA